MKTVKPTTLLLLVLILSVSTFGQTSDGTNGTVFIREKHSFVLKEPPGWLMESRQQGVEAVLYREGSSWKDAVAVMYARVIAKDEVRGTVETVIRNDIADFLKLSKESKVSDLPPLNTRDKKVGIAKAFYDAANKNYESVVFIDEPKVVVIIVLSSREKGEYEKSLPDFKALVESYFAFTPLIPR
jgi:hypothetical protein